MMVCAVAATQRYFVFRRQKSTSRPEVLSYDRECRLPVCFSEAVADGQPDIAGRIGLPVVSAQPAVVRAAVQVVVQQVEDIGIERIFPVNSPMISLIEVVRRADTRRAKLYFLRDRVGKSRRLRDRRRGLKHVKDSPVVAGA